MHTQQQPMYAQTPTGQPLPHSVHPPDRFAKQMGKKAAKTKAPQYDENGIEIKQSKSFYENYKVLIIVFIVVICLVLGVLVAVLVTQKKKAKEMMLGGGGYDAATGLPQYVGGMDFGNNISALPQRAWNESASVFVRR